MNPSLSRRLPRALLATVIVLVGLVSPIVAPVAAADDDGLSLVTDATYTLLPDQGLVHVSVAVTAENTKPNLVRETPSGTITTRYFFESATFAVQAEAAAVTAKAGETAIRTRVTPDDGFATVRVDFPSDLDFGETLAFTFDFDLPGGLPRSDSDIRVGTAFATFYAWAFGDGGDVRIVVPRGYDVEASGSPTEESVDAGVTTVAATGVDDVAEWYTIIVADRPDALTQQRLDLPDGEHLVIQAWPEDEEWRNRVRDLLEVGLPTLTDKVGLEWPVEGDLHVSEVHTPLLEGYAGFFFTEEDRIEISEDLDELTIMHEASHAWFNDRLFVGRWIGEGLADEYASRVLDEVSNGGLGPERVGRLTPGAIALNDWAPPGRIADEETSDREAYAYNASWALVRELMDDTGEDGMRKVLAAAHAHRTTYVGAGEPETIGYANDWRRFLDLLEDDGGSTHAVVLFRQSVVSEADKPLLEERAAARRAYFNLVEAGDGWLPGYAVRDPLGRWQFEQAHEAIENALEVLEAREELEVAAEEAGLTLPPSLRQAYEGVDGHFDPVFELASDQLVLVEEIDATAEVVATDDAAIDAIGLLGSDPSAGIERARAAFEAGDLGVAQSEIDAVEAVMAGAGDAGRTRVLAVGGVGVVVVAGIGLGVVARRRRRAGAAMAPARVANEPAQAIATGAASVEPAPAAPGVTVAAPQVAEPAPQPEAAPEPEPTPDMAAGPEPASDLEPYATLGAPRPAGSGPEEPADVDREGGDGS